MGETSLSGSQVLPLKEKGRTFVNDGYFERKDDKSVGPPQNLSFGFYIRKFTFFNLYFLKHDIKDKFPSSFYPF